MKKNPIILLLILLPFFRVSTTFAQIIVNENVVWSVADFPSEVRIIHTNHYKFEGDTTINGFKYKRIIKTSSKNMDNWFSNNEFIREDNDKVYHYLRNGGLEYLLYDFTLEVADTFKYYWMQNINFIVDSIKTLDLQGRQLKHWYLYNTLTFQTSVFIEKIGSYFGVTNPFGNQMTGAMFELLCVTENGEFIYDNPEYDSCHLNKYYTGVQSINRDDYLQVFSNESNQVQIENGNNFNGIISFFTTEGKEVLKEPISNSTTLLCLPLPGIFIYRFQLENGGVQTGKVMVK